MAAPKPGDKGFIGPVAAKPTVIPFKTGLAPTATPVKALFPIIKPVVPNPVIKPLLPTFPKTQSTNLLTNNKVVGGPLASGYVPLKTVSTGKFQGPMIDPNTGKSLIKSNTKPVPVPPPAKPKPKPTSRPTSKPTPKTTTPPKVETKIEEEVEVTEQKTLTDLIESTGQTDLFPTPYVAYTVPQNDGSIAVVKPAGPELLVVGTEQYTQAYLEKILFENLTGVEIINVARHDMVDGANIEYSDISNLGKISTLYGGANLVALQNTSEQIFKRYPIRLESYVPSSTSDPNGRNSPVYMNSSGSIVVEVANAVLNEEVDIHVISATDDTIY
jgi:hypothetical protein